MYLVGLTGGIASGKSTVARMLAEAGIVIIDADAIAREVVEPGCKAWKLVKREFGSQVFNDDETLNRDKLGQIIFSSAEQRQKLNAITHPEITKVLLWRLFISLLSWHQFVVLDVPLLFSSTAGTLLRSFLHCVVVVSCHRETQKARLMARNGLTTEEAATRMGTQMARAEQEALADVIIWNDGTLDETRERVDSLIKTLTASRAHWKIRALCIGLVAGLSAGFFHYFSRSFLHA